MSADVFYEHSVNKIIKTGSVYIAITVTITTERSHG